MGYGDVSPKYWGTRLFGCVYVILVVITTARIVGKIGDTFLASNADADVAAILGKKPDAAFLRSLDTDGSGDVTAIEYLSAMLVRLQYVEQDKIDRIMKAFHKLDSDGSGTLSVEDLVGDLDKDAKELAKSGEENIVPSKGGKYSFVATSKEADATSHEVEASAAQESKAKDGESSRGASDIIEEAEKILDEKVDSPGIAANGAMPSPGSADTAALGVESGDGAGAHQSGPAESIEVASQ